MRTIRICPVPMPWPSPVVRMPMVVCILLEPESQCVDLSDLEFHQVHVSPHPQNPCLVPCMAPPPTAPAIVCVAAAPPCHVRPTTRWAQEMNCLSIPLERLELFY